MLRVPLHYHVIRGSFTVHGRELQLLDAEYQLLKLILDMQKDIDRRKLNHVVSLSYKDAGPVMGTESEILTARRVSETINSLSNKIAAATGRGMSEPAFQFMVWNLEKARYELSSTLQLRVIRQHYPIWMETKPIPRTPNEADVYTIWLYGKPYSLSRRAYQVLKMLGRGHNPVSIPAIEIYRELGDLETLSRSEMMAAYVTFSAAVREIAQVILKDPVQVNRIITLSDQGYQLSPSISVEFAGK